MINEIVWKLFEYSLCLIEMYFLYIFLNEVIERKENVPKYINYSGIIGTSIVIYFLSQISNVFMVKTGIGYLLCVLIGILFYKEKLRLKIFWVTIYYIALGFIDIVLFYLMSFIVRVSISEFVLNFNWYRIILSVFAKLLLFIFIKLIAKTTRKTFNDVPMRFWKIILGVFLISIICVMAVMEVGILIRGSEIVGLFLVVISLSILILSIAFYQIFQYVCEYFEKEKQYQIMEYQNEMMINAALERDETHKEIRKIWHDFNNHISCIDMLLQMDNVKRARQYIQDMKVNSEKIHFEIKTGNEIADAVINQKYMKAKKNGVEFSVKGFLGENIGINAIDLCALLSNALDNAIEANLKIEDEANRKIQVLIRPYKDYLLIEIVNAVKEEIKNIENLETTKNDKSRHGFGMLNMKKIAEKYEGYLKFTCENSCFNLSIMLKIISQ